MPWIVPPYLGREEQELVGGRSRSGGRSISVFFSGVYKIRYRYFGKSIHVTFFFFGLTVVVFSYTGGIPPWHNEIAKKIFVLH